MSLLLDALKKAAEQKAEKNKQEVPPAGSSDETEVVAVAEDVSELEGGVDSNLRHSQRALQDETEIDDSDFNTRLEQTRVEREDGTDTRLEGPDNTATEIPALSAQMQTGEDETIIFAEEDVEDFMGETRLTDREQRAPEDETDLSQLAPSEDQTAVGEGASRVAEDETDLSQLLQHEDAADVSKMVAEPAAGDETDLSQLTQREDEADVSQLAAPRTAGDETDLSQLASREDDTDISQPFPLTRETAERGQETVAEDETDSGNRVGAEDQTDISVPPASVADLEYAAAQQQAAGADADDDISQVGAAEDVTDADDEDMSLLLVERDQTNLTGPTSATDPQLRQDQIQALQGDSGIDGLALVDTTRHQMPPEVTSTASATQTSSNATTGIALDTQTGATTRTYAPDNYDRTLMRLPSDDASKLFAGMKSDSDVVMTPEYAKKVFDSKSSAQRMQHYKIYSGIAAIILLGLAVFGFTEWVDQSDSIDASLRSLKRDPMPGIIRPATPQAESLFAQAEVDERTIDIIQNADNASDEPVPDAGVIAGESVPDATEAADAAGSAAQTEARVTTATPAQAEVSMIETAPVVGVETRSQGQLQADVATEVESRAQPTSTGSAGGQTPSTFEISSKQRLEQKSIWLREAYAAYQAGNDALAMSLYNKVLEIEPQNRNALLARAAIHVQNNNSREAIRDYRTLLLANPKDSLAMTSLISVANYSPQDTETQLKLMIREEPDSPYLNFALGNAYGAQNRWLEAQSHYFRALENNPGDPNYAYNLAVSLEHISQPRAAISYYRRALDNISNGLATFSREVVEQRLEILGRP